MPPPRRSSRFASVTPVELPVKRPLSESEADENVRPTRKARKAKVTTKKPTKLTKITVIDESDEEIQAPPSAQPRPILDEAVNDAQVVKPEVEKEEVEKEEVEREEEEEERSLFDPPPMPEPSSLPQAMPEEPAGPKSRLVIHKMVLINFKSYAGRQEIGPFHKVININR